MRLEGVGGSLSNLNLAVADSLVMSSHGYTISSCSRMRSQDSSIHIRKKIHRSRLKIEKPSVFNKQNIMMILEGNRKGVAVKEINY